MSIHSAPRAPASPSPGHASGFNAPAFSLHAADDIGTLARCVLQGPSLDTPLGEHRLALVDPTPERLAVASRIVARGVPHAGPRGIWFQPRGKHIASGKCAFLFPGVDNRPLPNLDDVSRHFAGPPPPQPGIDPGDTLARSRQSMESGILLDHAMRQLGVRPDGRAGLSCGEWAALTVTGGFVNVAPLLDYRRAGLPLPNLVYLAAAINANVLREILATTQRMADVAVSHENSPSQSVACGPIEDIGRLREILQSKGVITQELAVRSGFHVPAFAPHVDAMLGFLELEARPPNSEVWSCVSATPFPAERSGCSQLLRRHFVEPVNFLRLVRAMHADDYRVFVELGSGALCAMVADTLDGMPHVAVPAAHHSRPGLESLQRALLALWTTHVGVDPFALAPHPRALAVS
ncbi:acyltransferase domain-containing protein [Pinirhizobacter sp.]|jgi:hypothetical protein|uniref:acyltransferase domain-containing protein n=1 Tax=Pinirhizobacter sp. TaxID=2950432 RepID=UPI002F3F7669